MTQTMQLESYPKIGTKVKYIQHVGKTGEFIHSEGIIHAITMDPSMRLMAHLDIVNKEGQSVKTNVDLRCLNPSDEFIEDFKKLTADILKISKEGNDIVKKTVELYNTRVAKAHDGILGKPVVFETLAPQPPEKENNTAEPQQGASTGASKQPEKEKQAANG